MAGLIIIRHNFIMIIEKKIHCVASFFHLVFISKSTYVLGTSETEELRLNMRITHFSSVQLLNLRVLISQHSNFPRLQQKLNDIKTIGACYYYIFLFKRNNIDATKT